MKIYKSIGSKERFLEIFQGVNKVKINEAVIASDNTIVTKSTILTNAFNELNSGAIKITNTNSQSDNNNNNVEISGTDDAGNHVTFRFSTSTSQGDQDGVLSVDSAKLIEIVFRNNTYDVRISEEDKLLQQFNTERSQEIIDVVSEYVQDDSGAPEDTELYEDAVNLIDKIPYRKGTEDMQTNAAYADQKPTNPDVRVQSDELQKFISEIQDYEEDDYTQTTSVEDPMADPTDYSDDDAAAILKKDDDGTKGIDPWEQEISNGEPLEEPVSPEEVAIINKAYENLINRGNQSPTVVEIMAEIDKLEGKVPAPKTRGIPKGAESFWESSIVGNVNTDNIVTKGFENLLSPETKNQVIGAAIEILNMRLGVKKFQMPKEQYLKTVKDLAVMIYHRGASAMNEEDEKGDYPDQMGKSFKIKSKYPKKKKKIQTTVRIGEELNLDQAQNIGSGDNDGMSLEPQGDEVEQIAQEKEKVGDEIEGGKAAGKSPLEYNPEQILKGIKIELEHTDDPMKAVEIAMDHLEEISDYYDRLEKMEAEAKTNGAGSTDPMNPSGCFDDRLLSKDNDKEMTDMLLGYEPKNVGDEVKEEEDVFGTLGDIFRPEPKPEEPQVQEEIGMKDYKGGIGDKYADAEGNEFSVSNKVKGGVSLRGQGGEKEVATGDLTLMKKLSESKEAKPLITEEQIKIARRTLSKSKVSTGMSKKDAVQILIKNNIK